MAAIFYGWVIVLVAAISYLFSFGPLVGVTFGIFLNALADEFNWNRAEIAAAYSISLSAMTVCSPVVGKLVDRWGARRVIIPAAALFGGALMSLAWLSPHLGHLYVVFAVIGMLSGGSAHVPYARVISNWFDRRRGLALGLSMAGLGIGTTFMPFLAHLLIQHLGWRAAYALLGSLPILAVVPIAGLLLKEKPEDLGLWPDGVGGNEGDRRFGAEVPSSSGAPSGLSPSEALRTRTFWIMGMAFFLMSLCAIGIMIHLVPLLVDRGLSAERAALAMSIFGAALLMGRVICGVLLDRFFAPFVAVAFFSLAGVGILLLWLGVGGIIAFVAAFLIGLTMGAEIDIIAYLVSRYFGLCSFGEIYGYSLSLYLLGGIVGPFLMGVGFEKLGSYREILLVLFLMTLIASGLLTRLGTYHAEPAWGRAARA
ncbi:MAG: MFS transporter [Blastocatellia bacterium]|nr:MFS transporter [Blastocatellia bacterium]MCS7156102.1 MFS transporter [Blastocatellia bacterium]MDW8169261.1 MFS transporter [Acidobacteriota bacterium]MDW8256120.1 MFS transporter [Acidobacteriota bacterium]